MSKPTPGPWVIDWDTFPDGYVWIETPTGRGVALVDEAIRADLNLIAAAPDLLEALSMYVRLFESHSITNSSPADKDFTGYLAEKARAAIKKATGE